MTYLQWEFSWVRAMFLTAASPIGRQQRHQSTCKRNYPGYHPLTVSAVLKLLHGLLVTRRILYSDKALSIENSSPPYVRKLSCQPNLKFRG